MYFLRAGDPEEMAVVFGVDVTASTQENRLPSFIHGSFLVDWDALMPDTVTLTRTVVALGGDPGPGAVYEEASGSVGNSAAALIPQNSAILLRKNTARGGARGRGRMFLPWAYESGTSNLGVLLSQDVTAFTAAANSWLARLITPGAGFQGGPAPMVLLHSSGGVTTPGLPDPVLSMTCDNVIGTQRTRLR
jgi:hypothetical protein